MICLWRDSARASPCDPARGRRRALAFCVALTAVSAAPAAAADLPDILRGTLSPGAVRWDGVVIGGQLAYSGMNTDFGNSTSSQIAFLLRNSTLEAEDSPSSWTTLPNKTTNAKSFGAFLGYNMQWDDLVLGADLGYNKLTQGESSATDSIDRIVTTSDAVTHNVNIVASSSLKLIDYGTVRGRAGYAFGQFLPYAMVGLAVGRFDYATTSTVTDDQTNPVATFGPVTTTDSQNNKFGYGYVYGLGMDVAITPSMFLRGEWEYVAFNKVGDIRSTLSTARVGLGIRF
jgi:outer membrane immunogenic protein